ncbi:TlpA family protein disulfide reductase [Solimicrobium silvestre]|uniref:AhpC/TSA family n=1 Tax=Solimicrobium silvestre TaxID=2099400 RepID=A0A2S9GXX3_9BURK|nr:TlpA disulfide reductase family protein [Solimicrobium silvestre]PRC92574.1 AhpC/TSA family [Solimicrobium silvestre]
MRHHFTFTLLKLLNVAAALFFVLASVNTHAMSDTPPANPIPPAASKDSIDTTTTPANAENKIREKLMLKKIQTITYQDKKGNALTADEFLKRIDAGESYQAVKKFMTDGPSSAVLSLVDKDLAPKPFKTKYNIKIGDKFPSFHLKQLDGSFVDNQHLMGRYTLFNFFFSECAPCIKEIPDLNSLALKNQSMNFVAMTFDSNSDAQQFVVDTNFKWKIVPDSTKFIDKVGVNTFPAFVLIDPRGVVVGIASVVDFDGADKNLSNWVNHLAVNLTAKK